jgi:hypothetical protein
MHSRSATGARRATLCGAPRAALCACGAAIALLALPAPATLAAGGSGGPQSRDGLSAAPRVHAAGLGTPGELLAPGRVEELLAQLPVKDLSAAQTAEFLAKLEGIEGLANLETGLLGGELFGVVHLEEGLGEGIEGLGASATLGELQKADGLLPTLESKLNGLLGLLGLALDTEQKQELTQALEKLDLTQLVGTLLAGANEPAQLTGLSTLAQGLVEKLGGQSGVEQLLGAKLEGPFSATTVEGAAKQLGSSTETVSDELGQTAATLPATSKMLTAPVAGNKLLAVAPAAVKGVAPAVKGLALGLLGGEEEAGSKGGEEKGGSGSGEGTGGNGSGEGKGGEGKGGSGLGQGGGNPQGTGVGGAGGQGSTASTGATTLVVNIPPNSSATGASGKGAAKAKRETPKVAVVSVHTRGDLATVLVAVPTAGRLTLSGPGLTAHTVTVRGAGRVSVELRLSKAGAATLRRRRRAALKVALRVSFKASNGVASSATRTVAFS